MKVMHLADLHLDSSLSSHYRGESAERRRQELLSTWLSAVQYAEKEGVRAILICGDLFDAALVSRTTVNAVLSSVAAHPEIRFFYLRGNHDASDPFSMADRLPENLLRFSSHWKSYRLSGHLTVSGCEGTEEAAPGAEGLSLREEDFNIVLLHGQIAEYGRGALREAGAAETLYLPEYRNRGIDYLALGHIHEPREGRLDGRGRYRYPGCLEGRGFDECGLHGFVLLEISEEGELLKSSFVDIARRHFWTVQAEIGGCESSSEMLERIRERLRGAVADPEMLGDPSEETRKLCFLRKGDGVKLILTGALSVTAEKSLPFLRQQLSEEIEFLKIEDRSRVEVDYQEYRHDRSLKGEFVRLLQEEEGLSEELRGELIRAGIRLLQGEEI